MLYYLNLPFGTCRLNEPRVPTKKLLQAVHGARQQDAHGAVVLTETLGNFLRRQVRRVTQS